MFDYADLNVPMLARMFDRRCRGYEAVGYTILLPASAVPGWPADVPLPVDPQWKKTTRPAFGGSCATASTRRWRICSSTWRATVAPTDEGVDRARSATEAFLYRRLETLPETAAASA